MEPEEELESLKERVRALESQVGSSRRSVRIRSERTIFGMPWYEIATGPCPERDEVRGHAHAVVAIGDIATGAIALGGIAQGYVAFGGLAIGVLAAVGGAAFGAVAVGGLAVGIVAVGGQSLGYVAI